MSCSTRFSAPSIAPHVLRIFCYVLVPWKLRSRPAIELFIGYFLILLVIWTPNPAQRILFWISFAWIVGASVAARRTDEELGFSFGRVRRGLWIIAAVVVVCLALIALADLAGALHPLFGPKSLPVHVWGYLIWALLQQFMLQDYFLLRLLRITGNALFSVLGAGFLFAAAHLPNPVLTVATLVWGIAACLIFLRYRSLYVLAVAHWMLGLCIAVTVPNEINHHMRVGLGYLRYGQLKDSASLPPLPSIRKPFSGKAGQQ